MPYKSNLAVKTKVCGIGIIQCSAIFFLATQWDDRINAYKIAMLSYYGGASYHCNDRKMKRLVI